MGTTDVCDEEDETVFQAIRVPLPVSRREEGGSQLPRHSQIMPAPAAIMMHVNVIPLHYAKYSSERSSAVVSKCLIYCEMRGITEAQCSVVQPAIRWPHSRPGALERHCSSIPSKDFFSPKISHMS